MKKLDGVKQKILEITGFNFKHEQAHTFPKFK